MNIIHEITLDFCAPGLVPRIHGVQGDHLTRQVAVTLLSGGRDWPIPAGVAAAIRYRKPDGTGGSYDTLPDGTSAWSAAGNVITFALAPQMLAVPGCVEAQAVLISGMDILATFSFQLIVARDPALEAIRSEDYFNWLQWNQEQLDLYVEKLAAEGTFTGATPNLTIGTVTTLPAGSNATASITGTAEDPVLHLGLPSGSAEGALMRTGGTMLGPIEMDGHKLTGLGTPAALGDAVPLGYLKDKVTVFNSLEEIGITAFPTTMLTVAETMPNNSILFLDSRYIISGGSREISDLGISSSGMYLIVKGNSVARIQLLHIYGTSASIRGGFAFGVYSHDTNAVVWSSLECESISYPGCRYRIVNDKTEWANPYMTPGTEYRTAGRWRGKTVYTKLVNCGKTILGERIEIAHGASATNIIRASGSLENGNNIPGYYSATEWNELVVTVHKIYITSGTHGTAQTAYVQIWYTKD